MKSKQLIQDRPETQNNLWNRFMAAAGRGLETYLDLLAFSVVAYVVILIVIVFFSVLANLTA